MSVAIQSTVNSYIGNGSTQDFTSPFTSSPLTIRVYVDGIQQVLNADYSQAVVAPTQPSGTAQYTVHFFVAPTTNQVVVVDTGGTYSFLSQQITYTNLQGNAAITETGLDRSVLDVQILRDIDYYTGRMATTPLVGSEYVLDFMDFGTPGVVGNRVFYHQPASDPTYLFANAYPYPVESRITFYLDVQVAIANVSFMDDLSSLFTFSLTWGTGGTPPLTSIGIHVLEFRTLGRSQYLGTYLGTLAQI